MKKFEKMLFCTDLDGTLYSDDKTVSKQNLEAIEYFKSEGGLFTFITGRVPQTTGEMCETIKPNAPYGCNNGGGIYDHIQDKYLWKTFISDEVLELTHLARAFWSGCSVHLVGRSAFCWHVRTILFGSNKFLYVAHVPHYIWYCA